MYYIFCIPKRRIKGWEELLSLIKRGKTEEFLWIIKRSILYAGYKVVEGYNYKARQSRFIVSHQPCTSSILMRAGGHYSLFIMKSQYI